MMLDPAQTARPLATLPPPEGADPRVEFLLTLGHALHTAGTASHRLEEILSVAAGRLSLGSQFFSTPTGLFASFGPRTDSRTYLLRVQPGDTDLGRLARLEAIVRAVLADRTTLPEAIQAIECVESAKPPYGPALTTLAFGAASGAAALFLGGGWPEILLGTGVGLLIGILALFSGPRPALGRIFEPVAAFIAAFTVAAAGTLTGGVSVPLATLAGLIVLMPGFSLTTAMAELATRHLSAGTSRLSGAFIVFLGIGFGVALGTRLAGTLLGVPSAVLPAPLPASAIWLAVAVAAWAFTIILRAEWRDLGWITLSGAIAVTGARFGAATLGQGLGMFVGALSVGVAGNIYSRLAGRPAAVVLVPGVLMLVPGSVGFRSVLALLEREVVAGVDTAFQMILVAMALVAGLLMANVVSSERHLEEGSPSAP